MLISLLHADYFAEITPPMLIFDAMSRRFAAARRHSSAASRHARSGR